MDFKTDGLIYIKLLFCIIKIYRGILYQTIPSKTAKRTVPLIEPVQILIR